MNKLKEAWLILNKAARYSFQFCWRNSKTDTIAKLLISASNTLVVYLTVQATGSIINAVQHSMAKGAIKPTSFMEFIGSDIGKSLLYLIGVLLFAAVTGRLNWFYGVRWTQWLGFAN